ncbi:hypothetical protein [Pelagibacterium luteolum]|uniref:Uncharacterized protein n=1 Tax=Pelagibacterium luteolum TaxID=440168 RepID=A0A1G7W1J4_9HYPH|nr:hypothetical protein [Pelagibacterium luteolum]SDG65857.1 hypothetical protein SAMN04487974_105151 [Pelagibacterium luteolum]
MSMREKVAWISTLTALVIFGYYFWSVLSDFGQRQLDGDVLFWRFIWCLGIAVAIMLPASLLAAWIGKQQFDPPPDEMEQAIERRSYRAGFGVLEVSLIAIILLSGWIAEMARADYPVDAAGATSVIMVNLLLFAMALAGVLREIQIIVAYRRYA